MDGEPILSEHVICLTSATDKQPQTARIGGDTSGGGLRETTYLANEVNQMNAATNSSAFQSGHSWGPDIGSRPSSRSNWQAAGGVGGLVSSWTSSEQVNIGYDANGNVTATFSNFDGVQRAAYEYDPFGNPIRHESTPAKANNAQANPFRFSTKFTDDETGLLYYGYRFYDPKTGRWPNRDPIGERGGLNLYGFVGNDGVNWWDFLGL